MRDAGFSGRAVPSRACRKIIVIVPRGLDAAAEEPSEIRVFTGAVVQFRVISSERCRARAGPLGCRPCPRGRGGASPGISVIARAERTVRPREGPRRRRFRRSSGEPRAGRSDCRRRRSSQLKAGGSSKSVVFVETTVLWGGGRRPQVDQRGEDVDPTCSVHFRISRSRARRNR